MTCIEKTKSFIVHRKKLKRVLFFFIFIFSKAMGGCNQVLEKPEARIQRWRSSICQ